MRLPILDLLATVTLHWTNPGLARSAVPCADSTVRAALTQANIYRAPVGGTGAMVLLRSHAYTTTPLTDTLLVPDAPAATYWVIPVNGAGASECPPRGYTVGVPSVGVGEAPSFSRTLYDIAGRRFLASEAPPGVYFELVPGQRVKRIVRLR